MKDNIFLSDEQKQKLCNYFGSPNELLFQTLSEMVFCDPDAKKFRLERLNNGGVKPNTILPFAVPVREYAKMLDEKYSIPDGSIWKQLKRNGDILYERKNKKISRAAVIALAFVFRLSSQELDMLLEAAGYYRLSARSIPGSVLIFVLETYKKSKVYSRFEDASHELNEDEFIENYTYFNKLLHQFKDVASESRFAAELVAHMTAVPEGIKKEGSRTTWTLNREHLKDISVPGGELSLKLTQRCMEELKETVKESCMLDYGDSTLFEDFIDDNRSVFVQNREKALRYLFTLIERYENRERVFPNKKDYKNDYQKRAQKQIDLTTLSRRFTIFMDFINLYSAGEMFLRYYISCDEDFEEDIITFAKDCLPDNTDEEIAVELFYERIRMALSMSCSDYRIKRPVPKVPLEDYEKEMVRSVIMATIKKESHPSDDMSDQFRRIISGKADITRLFFVFFYLFVSHQPCNKNCRSTANEQLNELDEWLTDAGFPGIIGDKLEDFVRTFLESQMIYRKVERFTNYDGSFSYVYRQAEEEQFEFFFDTFNYVFSHKISINDLIQYLLDASSLYEEEMNLLLTKKEEV